MTIAMPKLTEASDDGVLEEYLVSEGDVIEEGAPVCAIEMDKATVEVEATCSGRVTRLLVQPGDTVEVDQALLELE